MAFNDALFQLGMDLARGSSTAQKEDHAVSAHGAQDSNRADDTGNRDSSRTSGNQLIIDLVGAKRIDDLDHIESALKRCVESAGGTLLHVHLHRGEADEAITGVGVLSQGTISFRSWPKRKLAVVDVLGNGGVRAERMLTGLADAFDASEAVICKRRTGTESLRHTRH
ncbi:MAG: S-adenosylmethionine decarboxylase [Hyphomicrobiaceae bacterium]|nr:S-adenosylmethionine decarboxylase [Hyphomicrobiaceae bacterium]